jgi:hypothetical protein
MATPASVVIAISSTGTNHVGARDDIAGSVTAARGAVNHPVDAA